MTAEASEAELYARINFLSGRVKELKEDLVDCIIEMKFLLKDIDVNSQHLAKKTLMSCPIWYLRQERKILRNRTGKILNTFCKGLKKERQKQKFAPGNRLTDYFE